MTPVCKKIELTEAESVDVANELGNLIFNRIISERMIRLPSSSHGYSYTRKLDDRNFGREHELAIHIISPFHKHAGNTDILRMQNMGKSELLVVMPPDRSLLEDCMRDKQTDKYIRHNISQPHQDSVNMHELQAIKHQCIERIAYKAGILLSQATLISHGAILDIGGEDAQGRIVKGFQELVQHAYPNLRMLPSIAYTERNVGTCLRQSDGDVIDESEQEMLAAVEANTSRGVRTPVSELVSKFAKKPYGWPYTAILCTLAKLCGVGKVEVRQDSNPLEESELERALCSGRSHANLIVEPQSDFTAFVPFVDRRSH